MSIAHDPSTSDKAGLRSLSSDALWTSAAPKRLRTNWNAGDPGATWDELRKALAATDPPADWLGVDVGAGSPYLWGFDSSGHQGLEPWLARLDGAIAKRQSAKAQKLVDDWAAKSLERESTPPFAVEAVALSASLARLAAVLSAECWWRLADTLVALIDEAARCAAPDPADTEAVVVDVLLSGELPSVLGRVAPQLQPFAERSETARTAVSTAIERLTDGEGLAPAPIWMSGAAGLLLASWTRLRSLGGGRRGALTADARLQYEWFVRQSLRLVDRQGRFAWTGGEAASCLPLLRAAISLGGDDADRAAAGERLKGFSPRDEFEPPAPSNHSEWAELGVLAAGWRDKAPRIAVAHPADSMAIELQAGKAVVLAGDWPIEVRIDGKSVAPTDEWDCACWHSDEDGDYLELALELTGEARLERQFFLAREDGVAYMSETVFSGRSEPCDIEIVTSIPLGPGVAIRPERETRDALLTHAGAVAGGLLPLALPEWRDEHRGGELTAADGRLRLTRQSVARNLMSALWIDCSPRRFEKQRTWRQLTVAESLKRVAADVAVGFRAQSGKDQWIVYRALDRAANRTLVGHNLSSEAMVGRFKKDGSVDEYFEIEAEAD